MGEPNIFGDILLVEDNPGDVRLTKEMLKEGGLNPTIHVVNDGPDAIAFLQRKGEYSDAPRPDMVLLDLHLVKMDGEEVLAEMDGDASEIPVVAMSGSQEGAELKLSDIENDVVACLEKPIDPDEIEEVAELLGTEIDSSGV